MRYEQMFAVVIVMGFVGCSSSNPRQEISGTITLKNEKLDDGMIMFRPIAGTTAEGLSATAGGANITQGVYHIDAESGLVPGKYKVLITSGDGKTPDDPNEAPGPSGNFVSKDRIPAEFNTKSNVEIEVKADAENVFDFPIP